MSTEQKVFKIGTVTVVADGSLANLTNDAARDLLKTQYPEVAHATIRERHEDGMHIVEFLPKPGRKG